MQGHSEGTQPVTNSPHCCQPCDMGTTRPALNHVSNRPSLAEVPDTTNSSNPSHCENHTKKQETIIASMAGRSATGHLNAAQPVLRGVQWAHTIITNESSDISALQKVAEIMCYSDAAVLLM